MRETNCPACMGLGSSEWGECTTCDGTGIAPTPSVSPETPTPNCPFCGAPEFNPYTSCASQYHSRFTREDVAASPVGAERTS